MATLTSLGNEVILGNRYRDILHGIEGVAVGKYDYLTGCTRVNLEWVKDGEIKNCTFDAPQLIEADTGKRVKSERKIGGPRSEPPRVGH